jgi:Lon protease-like protein
VAELQIPIFPLPEVVFFPETVLPLHVFEPRYRRLVADCLAGDRWLAVTLLRPGWERDYEGRPPVHAVAGAGEIIHCEALADGRYNILIDGRTRIRIEEEIQDGRPYRRARARRLPDVLEDAEHPGLAEGMLTLRAAHAKLLEALGQAHPDLVGRLTAAGAPPGAVIDRIVSAVVPDAAVRQRVLETVEVGARLEVATAALFDLLALVSGPDDSDKDQEDDE